MNTPEFKTEEFQSFIDEVIQNKVEYRVVEEISEYFNTVFIPQLKCKYTNNKWIGFDKIIEIVNSTDGGWLINGNHIGERYNEETEEYDEYIDIILNSDSLLKAKLIISDLKNNLYKLKLKTKVHSFNDIGNIRDGITNNDIKELRNDDKHDELAFCKATTNDLDIPELN